MTLEEAIVHAKEVANDYEGMIDDYTFDSEKLKKCAAEHRQLAEWLSELQEKRKQSEIIRCGECLHYKPMSNHWGKCGIHSSPAEKYRTCQICDYCSWAERRADETD